MNDYLTNVEKNVKNNASKIEESLVRIKKCGFLTVQEQEKIRRELSSLEVEEQLLLDLFSSIATLGGLKEYFKTEKINVSSAIKAEGLSSKEIIEKLKDIRQLKKFGYDSIVAIELEPLLNQMNELLAAYSQDMVNLKKYQSRKGDLLKYYERVLEVISKIKQGEIISIEEYRTIAEEVRLSSLSREEQSHLLFDLVKAMSNKMNEKITAYVEKEKQAKEAEKEVKPPQVEEEVVKTPQVEVTPEEVIQVDEEVIIEEQILEPVEVEEPVEVIETPKSKIETDELYQELVTILGTKADKMNSRFIVLNTSIKDNFDFNIRERNIYPSIKDLEEKIKFILFDLKVNLLIKCFY